MIIRKSELGWYSEWCDKLPPDDADLLRKEAPAGYRVLTVPCDTLVELSERAPLVDYVMSPVPVPTMNYEYITLKRVDMPPLGLFGRYFIGVSHVFSLVCIGNDYRTRVAVVWLTAD